MIGKIKGILSEVEANQALIETPGGVFYEVYLSNAILSAIHPGDNVEVYTYFHVREDLQILFGFQEKKEYHVFKLLLSVSGVGPKTAFTVISHGTADKLIQAATTNDVEYFSKIPGLGKKTALKILLELSQKLKAEFSLENLVVSEDDKTVIDALVSLGFKSSEAKQILTKIPKDLSIEDKITEVLKLTSKHKQ